jgi:putative transposase
MGLAQINRLYIGKGMDKSVKSTKFLGQKQIKELVFVDESSINHQDIKKYAWPEKGVKVIGERYEGTTVISGIYCGKITVPFHFDDYMNTDNFCILQEKVLCPELRPGQVVIMDNASFHKSPRIRKIIENVGCQLLYLPPYSPDLNPIEHYWAWLKNKLSYLWHHVANFFDRLSFAPNLNYGATFV